MPEIALSRTQGVFDQLYGKLRLKEGRLFSDEDIPYLPQVHSNHPYHKEWVIRKHSSKALINYITHKENFASILEVGCGNGWLCSRIAHAVDAEVTGIDVNSLELEQAKRVFNKVPGLRFIHGSVDAETLQDKKFDLILFAASIQYFPSLPDIIRRSLEHLTLMGEIHIMDSPFYPAGELEAARQRTKEYYTRMGLPEMSRYYHHHQLSELIDFQYKILHHPHSWKNKLAIKKNPFYWITIRNRYS